MHRRKFAAALVAATALCAAVGVSAAPVETKTIPAEDLFPFLRNYYALPAAERTQFHLGYALRVQGARPDQIDLSLQDGANKTRIAADAQGYLSPLPTDAQLKAKAKLSVTRPAEAKCGISMEVLPNPSPAQSMDAKSLALAVSQARAGSKKLAGVLAMAMPTLDRVDILGVTSGEVKLANGTTRPLPFTPRLDGQKGRPTSGPPDLCPGGYARRRYPDLQGRADAAADQLQGLGAFSRHSGLTFYSAASYDK